MSEFVLLWTRTSVGSMCERDIVRPYGIDRMIEREY